MANTETKPQEAKSSNGVRPLLSGLFFGIIFGFLLQKGGVAKYHVLIGMLLLEDFTVAKVMLTAIAVGTLGVHILYTAGLIQLHTKPTRYLANIGGGIMFGIGFGLLGYCPGTGAAALGQGNLDAIVGIVGLMAGSYLFAELSGWIDRTVNKVGDRGKLQLHEVLGVSRTLFVSLWLPVLILALIGSQWLPRN